MSDGVQIKRPVPPVPARVLTQWLLTILAGFGAGIGLKEAFTPTLTALVGGSAGVVASFIVEWVRVLLYDSVDRAANAKNWHAQYGKWLSYFLYNPRGIRVTMLVVTLTIGALAAGSIDWIAGAPLNIGLASAWAFIGSQVAHLRSLSSQPASMDAAPLNLDALINDHSVSQIADRAALAADESQTKA